MNTEPYHARCGSIQRIVAFLHVPRAGYFTAIDVTYPLSVVFFPTQEQIYTRGGWMKASGADRQCMHDCTAIDDDMHVSFQGAYRDRICIYNPRLFQCCEQGQFLLARFASEYRINHASPREAATSPCGSGREGAGEARIQRCRPSSGVPAAQRRERGGHSDCGGLEGAGQEDRLDDCADHVCVLLPAIPGQVTA